LRPSSFDDMGVTLSIQLFLIVIGTPMLSLSVLLEQQRKTEQCLRESEGRFRNMADTAPVMIWVAGEDSALLFSIGPGWIFRAAPSIARLASVGFPPCTLSTGRDVSLPTPLRLIDAASGKPNA